MTSAVPPPGVSIADARLEEVSDGIYAYIQPDLPVFRVNN
jgi:hypothetical protein